MNTKRLPIAEWLYKWLNENPTATIEEGLKAFELSKDVENTSFDEISDYEIDKAANEAFLKIDDRSDFFKMGAKWYREQLKSRQ